MHMDILIKSDVYAFLLLLWLMSVGATNPEGRSINCTSLSLVTREMQTKTIKVTASHPLGHP